MSVRWLGHEAAAAGHRGDIVVGVIGDLDRADDLESAVSVVRERTPPEVPVAAVTAVDAVPELDRLVHPADLVLMSAGCRPPDGWLNRLSEAARSDGTVATATPLGQGSVGVTPNRVPNADRRVAEVSLRTRPRVLIGGPDCIYVRRAALDLIGGVPSAHSGLAELAAAVCAASAAAGMVNVVADDLYVGGELGGGPALNELAQRLAEHDRADERSALQRVVALSRSALAGLTVTIDARALGPNAGGTQLYTLELALALARTGDVAVRMVVADADVTDATRALLQETDQTEVITYEQAVAGVELSEIVHRPQQVFSVHDLNLLRLLGRRIVVTHQDLIAYHNPTYHANLETWDHYRRVTRIALAAADRVVFFSSHSLRDAIAEDLVTGGRCDVIGAAVSVAPAPAPRVPLSAPTDRDFIVCLGPDYRHKNRRFALELLAALRAEHGWPGLLVFAGSHVEHGSSAPEERALLAADAELREAVVDLGSVDDGEREWLFDTARAVLVPSVVEGFGLVPLEAARAGRPCLFAAVSSLPEVVSTQLATLEPWDASISAARVAPLLRDGPERDAHVARLRADAERWRWDELAAHVLDSYAQAMRMPYRAAAVRAWQELERERYLVELHEEYQGLRRRLGDRIALATEDGYLTAHEQRGLLRVGSRPVLARAVLWPFALVGAIRHSRPRRDTDR